MLVDKTQEYRRLAMGPLLHDLQQKMQKKVDYGDKEPLKLLIHSTHDTALAGIASTLDVFDLRWVLKLRIHTTGLSTTVDGLNSQLQ